MNTKTGKASRGRPKTLNREHILDVATQAYWEEGIGAVSLNELCKKAKVSKPGLYREFGNEDGLMKAVMFNYEKNILSPLFQMLAKDQPFRKTLDEIVKFVTSDSEEKKMPNGCLFVCMRESYNQVGETTREQLDDTAGRVLAVYEDWVERAKAKGEFTADISSQFAAIYLFSQISFALSQMARGEDRTKVKAVLGMALSMF